MSADTEKVPGRTMAQIKEDLLTEVSNIVKTISPDIATDVKTQIQTDLKRTFDSGLEKEKKLSDKAVSEIVGAQADALAKLKKELQEAKDEIATSKKSATTAFTDAMADWTKALNLDPKISQALRLIPDVSGQFAAVIEAAKQLKSNKHDITINVVSFVGTLLGLAVTVMILVTLVMQVFGK